MTATQRMKVKDGDVVLMVGTVKGAFLLRSSAARTRWDVTGPLFKGQSVYAFAYDSRDGRHRIWASAGNPFWGVSLVSSDDFGRTWNTPEKPLIRFPEDSGAKLEQIWQIVPGRADEPGTLWCGVAPAALFVTRDSGESWQLVRGLWDHPHRPKWNPGAGGLCLHTILPDPVKQGRMVIAISAAGVYRTEDDGASWVARNHGVRAEFMPDKHPEFGQCVHKIVRHPSRPERLFLQNHWGLYRSDDGADSWQDIAHGVPSDFGFAMAQHPHDPETVYIVPLEADMFRCTPEGKLRVYRTRDAGGHWEALTKGLPQKNALETVLRDAMTVDTFNPAGIYFGTRNGAVWGSSDGGASWSTVLAGLPAITCVKAAVIGEPRRSRAPKPGAAARTKTQAAPRRAGARPKPKTAPNRNAAARTGRRAPKPRPAATRRTPARRKAGKRG